MANTLLTPITLWRDFDDTLPLETDILYEEHLSDCVVQDLSFSGRQTEKGRVRVFARFVHPEAEHFPAVMVLFEAGLPFDGEFVSRLVRDGYGVLCVDYCGDNGTVAPHTVYPGDVSYANYTQAGRHIEYVDTNAKETSWYEWAAVARYGARFLFEHPKVTAVGAVGMRTGGEILFKIAPYAPISCMISVCAAGWLAYRNVNKFGDTESRSFDEERHRFIAGIDSQSYAPYAKCPVLLLCPINDPKMNCERVYDTFSQINPQVEKAILFSAHSSGLIGSHSMRDLDLFLGKYLKKHSVFIPGPADVSVGADGENNLVVRSSFDVKGEIEDYGIFFTEKVSGGSSRDWTRVLGKKENLKDGGGTIPLNAYKGIDKALVYAFVNYSNNFSVTSKILEVQIKPEYKNLRPKTRVIYTSADGLNGFSPFSLNAHAIADCFNVREDAGTKLLAGYGGIMGISCGIGLISYRVGEPRYQPPAGASFRFDAWSPSGASVTVRFFKVAGSKENYHSGAMQIDGGGVWKSFLLDPGDFKSEAGALKDFSGVLAVMFDVKGDVVFNNVLWI